MTGKQINERMRPADQEHQTWRAGEPAGRGIYVDGGRSRVASDNFLGVMETPELAVHVVSLHNRVARNDF